MASRYDVAIIGCGMAGLAAGIRLAHFGQRVCIFERHNAPGGLNSFYSIAGRKYDVGLHAMTNYVPAGVKGTPLGKLLRQLRIDRDELALREQRGSRVAFAGQDLRFSNDFSLLTEEVARAFPSQIDGFLALTEDVRSAAIGDLDAPDTSAREAMRRRLSDPLLEDMLLCPLMYYGSAKERDMDWSQFCILFRSIFLEGFARPLEGVRLVIRTLLDKYRQAGGERRMKCGVKRIVSHEGRAVGLVLDNGEEVQADRVFSTIGHAETMLLCGSKRSEALAVAGRLSFVETISVLSCQPAELGWGDDTIVFFNDSDRFDYTATEELVDYRSGVICIPNNFDFGPESLPEGLVRVTSLASYPRWKALPEVEYQAAKRDCYPRVLASAGRFLPAPARPLEAVTVATDMFTPRTIEKFTGHLNGAVYGAPEKLKRGLLPLKSLYLCGTDQGYLGIVGAMVSGISMANLHGLQGGGASFPGGS
jgi:phytoene dehydrogenase-like protein